MIIYEKCKLYGLKTKKQLLNYFLKSPVFKKKYYKNQLNISNIKKQEFFTEKVKPAVIDNKRLIEAPSKLLKTMQKTILKDLKVLNIPGNIFSGVKNRSHIGNITQHSGKYHFMKIDLSKFFPHIKRDIVYNFYKIKFNLPSDIANILTNLSTIDLKRIDLSNFNNLQKNNYENALLFMQNKEIKVLNHLTTGSRISPILSYLVNEEMFNEIEQFCKNHNVFFTIYVDDMAFSSNKKTSGFFKQNIYKIIRKYGYKINEEKTKIVDINNWKKITGGIIDKKGQIKCPKQLEFKLKQYNAEFKKGNFEHIQNMYGILIEMKQLEPNKYNSLYGIVHKKYIELVRNKTIIYTKKITI